MDMKNDDDDENRYDFYVSSYTLAEIVISLHFFHWIFVFIDKWDDADHQMPIIMESNKWNSRWRKSIKGMKKIVFFYSSYLCKDNVYSLTMNE